MSPHPTGDTHVIPDKPGGRGCACGIVLALCAALVVGAVIVVGVIGIYGALQLKHVPDGATLVPGGEWEAVQDERDWAAAAASGSWGEIKLQRDSHVYGTPDTSSASLRALKPGDQLDYYGFDESFEFYTVREGGQVGYVPLMHAEISFD